MGAGCGVTSNGGCVYSWRGCRRFNILRVLDGMGWDGESVDLIYRPVDGVEGVEGVECMEAVEAVVVVPWLPRWQWHILLQCTYYCSVHTYYCSAHTTAVATALDG